MPHIFSLLLMARGRPNHTRPLTIFDPGHRNRFVHPTCSRVRLAGRTVRAPVSLRLSATAGKGCGLQHLVYDAIVGMCEPSLTPLPFPSAVRSPQLWSGRLFSLIGFG